MKKVCISFSILFIIILLIALNAGGGKKEEYLRIHVRANSNSEADQTLKTEVKDKVVEYLTPIISEVTSLEEAKAALIAREGEINRVCESYLEKRGITYGARTRVTRESFPTRVYEGVTLEAGVYDALIIELGSGEGDNWWCVVYPPLCFTGAENVKYRSKIYDVIKNFNRKRQEEK